MTILEKIIEKASKITDERKQRKFLLEQMEENYENIPFAEIEKMFKELEVDLPKLKKKVDKFVAKKKLEEKK